MKNGIPGLLVAIVVLGLFAAASCYIQGAQTAANDNTTHPKIRPIDDARPRQMPVHRSGAVRGLRRGWDTGFFPLIFLAQLVVLALLLWLIY